MNPYPHPYPYPYPPYVNLLPVSPTTTNRQTLSILKQRTVHVSTACHRRPSTAAPAADDAPCLSGPRPNARPPSRNLEDLP